MNEQLIIERIDTIAQKLDIAAEQLWAILVRQSVLEAITWSIALVLCFVLSLIAFVYCKNQEPDFCDISDWNVATFSVGIISATFLLVILLTSPEFVTRIFNPEYHAWREITRLIQ